MYLHKFVNFGFYWCWLSYDFHQFRWKFPFIDDQQSFLQRRACLIAHPFMEWHLSYFNIGVTAFIKDKMVHPYYHYQILLDRSLFLGEDTFIYSYTTSNRRQMSNMTQPISFIYIFSPSKQSIKLAKEILKIRNRINVCR